MSLPVRKLLERAQPGARQSVWRHIRRGEEIERAIAAAWGVPSAGQWKAKHVRWALERWAADLAPSTRYNYWLTARVIVAALGRWPDWEPHLRGPWSTPSGERGAQKRAGGRPAKLAPGGPK